MYRECTEMVTPHIQCGHAVLILTEPTSNADRTRKTGKSNWDFQRLHTILYITVSVHLQHHQCSSTVLIYITLQHICTSGYNSTFMVRSITRLSSSGIVSNLPDCVVCHGARVIIGCANVSQIAVHIATLMTVMVTPCCSWCQCI